MAYNRLWKQRNREDAGKRCYNNGDTKHEFAVQCSKLNKGMMYAGEKMERGDKYQTPCQDTEFSRGGRR